MCTKPVDLTPNKADTGLRACVRGCTYPSRFVHSATVSYQPMPSYRYLRLLLGMLPRTARYHAHCSIHAWILRVTAVRLQPPASPAPRRQHLGTLKMNKCMPKLWGSLSFKAARRVDGPDTDQQAQKQRTIHTCLSIHHDRHRQSMRVHVQGTGSPYIHVTTSQSRYFLCVCIFLFMTTTSFSAEWAFGPGSRPFQPRL
jgi:hypothetical protein